jgi:hypothetical protein
MTNGSTILLYSMLSSSEWAKDTKTVYNAGKLCMKLANVADAMPKEAELVKTWEKEQNELPELEPAEFQVSVDAFKFFAQKGGLRPSRWSVELQELLKLTQ